MKIICDCGAEMKLSIYEPDQDENYEGYDCPNCKASFNGTYKKGEAESNEK